MLLEHSCPKKNFTYSWQKLEGTITFAKIVLTPSFLHLTVTISLLKLLVKAILVFGEGGGVDTITLFLSYLESIQAIILADP